MGERRYSVNEIVEGRIFQRGQMLTWGRSEKWKLLADHRVGVVVNLWPKIDPDLSFAPVGWYLHVPVAESAHVIDPRVLLAADAVAAYLGHHIDQSALILCEAGKTRSVFFLVPLLARLYQWTVHEALVYVVGAVPNHRLKPSMLAWAESNAALSPTAFFALAQTEAPDEEEYPAQP